MRGLQTRANRDSSRSNYFRQFSPTANRDTLFPKQAITTPRPAIVNKNFRYSSGILISAPSMRLGGNFSFVIRLRSIGHSLEEFSTLMYRVRNILHACHEHTRIKLYKTASTRSHRLDGNSGATAISRLTSRSSLNASVDRQAGFSSSRWRGASSPCPPLCLFCRDGQRFGDKNPLFQRVFLFDTRANTWYLNERSTFISTVRVSLARASARAKVGRGPLKPTNFLLSSHSSPLLSTPARAYKVLPLKKITSARFEMASVLAWKTNNRG